MKERMAEWLKAIDCKSIDKIYIGSNPIFFNRITSLMVEFLAYNEGVGGSNPLLFNFN